MGSKKVRPQLSIIPYTSTSLRLGLAGQDLIDTKEERTTEVYSVRFSSRTVVMIRPAGLETPEQISGTERRGDMFKKMMTTVNNNMHASAQRIEGHDSRRRTSQTCCVDKGRALWLDHTQLVAWLCTAGNHEQVNTDRDGTSRSRLIRSEKDKNSFSERLHIRPHCH